MGTSSTVLWQCIDNALCSKMFFFVCRQSFRKHYIWVSRWNCPISFISACRNKPTHILPKAMFRFGQWDVGIRTRNIKTFQLHGGEGHSKCSSLWVPKQSGHRKSFKSEMCDVQCRSVGCMKSEEGEANSLASWTTCCKNWEVGSFHS